MAGRQCDLNQLLEVRCVFRGAARRAAPRDELIAETVQQRCQNRIGRRQRRRAAREAREAGVARNPATARRAQAGHRLQPAAHRVLGQPPAADGVSEPAGFQRRLLHRPLTAPTRSIRLTRSNGVRCHDRDVERDGLAVLSDQFALESARLRRGVACRVADRALCATERPRPLREFPDPVTPGCRVARCANAGGADPENRLSSRFLVAIERFSRE